MIKKAGYIFTFIFITHSYGQNFELRFSDVEKMGFREIHDRSIGYGQGYFDELRFKFNAFGEVTMFADHFETEDLLKKYSIEVFKKDLYKSNIIQHKIEFEEAFLIDSSLIILFSHFNTEKLENILYAALYVDGYLIGNPVEINKIKTPNRFEKGYFVIEYDLNKKTFMSIGVEADNKTNTEVYRIHTHDQELNSIWKQNLDIPYKENKYELEQLEMDDNNRVFLLFRIILNKDQQKQKELPNADYYFSLLQLSASQEDDYLETVLKIEDKSVYNMWMDVKKNPGKILLTGLFYNKKTDLKPKGVYFTEFDKDSATPNSIKVQTFSDDFIPDFETESPFTEVTEGDPEVKLIDLVQGVDKGYYLLAEYIFINETCMPDYRSGLMSCNYNFYYNDIFIFKFDSTGSLQRKFRIPKKQFTRNDGAVYSSFAYGILKNQLVLLYNDHPKNLKPKNPAHLLFMTDARKSNLAAVTVNEKGLVEKEFLVNNDKKKTWCKPQVFFSTYNQSIILLAERGRMFQHIEIK